MQSQQVFQQGRTRYLSISSQQQPDRSLRRRPVGIRAGLAATVLAALAFSLMLFFAVGTAVITRNEYRAMALRREIQDLRAQNALLRYQINLTASSQQIQEAADRMGLRRAELATEADYVFLPDSPRDELQLAAAGPTLRAGGLTATLADLATEVAGSMRGRAEASTAQGHRP